MTACDAQIWAMIDGHVKFTWSRIHNQHSVHVVSAMKYGHICEHKAKEARSFKKLLVAKGYLQQAHFAFKNAGKEGKERLAGVFEYRDKLYKEISIAMPPRGAGTPTPESAPSASTP